MLKSGLSGRLCRQDATAAEGDADALEICADLFYDNACILLGFATVTSVHIYQSNHQHSAVQTCQLEICKHRKSRVAFWHIAVATSSHKPAHKITNTLLRLGW